MSIARRQIVQMLGAIPFIGDQVVKTGIAGASETLDKLTTIETVGRPRQLRKMNKAQEMAKAILGGDPWDILRQAERDLDDEDSELAKIRVHGYDADIAALKSTAPVYKAMKQKERIYHGLALRKRVNLLLDSVDD